MIVHHSVLLAVLTLEVSMKKLLIVLAIFSTILTACGVKGPLYFPEQTAQIQQAQ